MGLNITEDKVVEFDDSHQKRVDTSFESNPRVGKVGQLKVYHLLRRNKTGDQDRDGNPLIYALKEMYGYRIAPVDRQRFIERAAAVLERINDQIAADFIMPVPSSKPFCAEFAQIVADVTGIPYLDSAFIRKRTVGEMLAQYGDNVPKQLNKSASTRYKALIAGWRDAHARQMVSMKDIDTKIRPHFDPLALTEDVPNIKGARIIIVDDLMSSGSSLTSTCNALASTGCSVPAAICFLSGLS
ncbi:phosphoribosyltransferase family protein [Asticcacaulis sp. AC460]|uniref:phosphoribosyltransferase family protein n=1 Tax=Asticcacaulis sp. AC460 TaxID=1282360 RepID=UPI00138AE2C6|nr:phosphoribosyltransferase family protein [Asticcacaulis sp. AC460]